MDRMPFANRRGDVMPAGPNRTVERFKRVLAALPKPARAAVHDELWKSASDVAEAMRSAASSGPTGNLKKSVRVERGRHELSVVIRAGGPLTTKPVRSGKTGSYDYSLANEFGTAEVGEQPFFWNTYNAKKKGAKNRVRKRARAAIADEARKQGLEVR